MRVNKCHEKLGSLSFHVSIQSRIVKRQLVNTWDLRSVPPAVHIKIVLRTKL